MVETPHSLAPGTPGRKGRSAEARGTPDATPPDGRPSRPRASAARAGGGGETRIGGRRDARDAQPATVARERRGRPPRNGRYAECTGSRPCGRAGRPRRGGSIALDLGRPARCARVLDRAADRTSHRPPAPGLAGAVGDLGRTRDRGGRPRRAGAGGDENRRGTMNAGRGAAARPPFRRRRGPGAFDERRPGPRRRGVRGGRTAAGTPHAGTAGCATSTSTAAADSSMIRGIAP